MSTPWRSIFFTHHYKVWSKLVFTTIIPLIVLVFCNVGIFVTLRRSRDSLRSSSNTELYSRRFDTESCTAHVRQKAGLCNRLN